MLGTIVNTCTITCGSILGTILKKGIKPKYQEALYNAMGMAAFMLGINAAVSHFPDSKYPVLFIVCLAIGSLIGYAVNLQDKFSSIVDKISKNKKSQLAEGLSTGILLYCIGTLSILGPVQSALYNDNTYLFTNATLDFVTSTVLASTYGIGMILAAPVLFIWQGSIYFITSAIGTGISNDLMAELSIVGGILITCSGISILKIKEMNTLNMLPSLFIPIIFYIII